MGFIIAFLLLIFFVLLGVLVYSYIPDCSEIVEDKVEKYFGYREYLPKKLTDQLGDIEFIKLSEKKQTINHMYTVEPVKQNSILLAMVNTDADVFYDYRKVTDVIAQTPEFKIYMIKVYPQSNSVPLILSTSSKPCAYIGYRPIFTE